MAEKEKNNYQYNPDQNSAKKTKNDIGSGGLIAKWMGKKGDSSEGNPNEKVNTKEYTQTDTVNEVQNEDTYNKFAGSEVTPSPDFYSSEFMDARDFGMNFNPRDKNSVIEMQNKLNNAGIVGENGKPLKADGVLGPQTMHALRTMQSGMIHEKEYATQLYSKSKGTENAVVNMQFVNKMIENDTQTAQNKAKWGEYFNKRTPKTPDSGSDGQFITQMRDYISKDKNA